jgi:hypothetical protein
MFYSYCYTHPGATAGNTGHRREVADEGIDAFVLGKCSTFSAKYPGDYGTGGHVEDLIGNLPKRYRDYCENLLGKPNVVLVRYEEMVTDYRGWLEKFIEPFPIEDKRGVMAGLVSQADALFPRRPTDVMQHVRHVTPGDHKTKLMPSTIRTLNEIFAETLDALGYEKGAAAKSAATAGHAAPAPVQAQAQVQVPANATVPSP